VFGEIHDEALADGAADEAGAGAAGDDGPYGKMKMPRPRTEWILRSVR
jgi:hypothetical protein